MCLVDEGADGSTVFRHCYYISTGVITTLSVSQSDPEVR